MAIAFVTITNSIAALSISSASDKATITIRDIDQVPQKVNPRDCPILFPDPTNFITEFVPTRQSYGPGTVAQFDIEYNMNYMFLYAPVGTGRGLFDVLPTMLQDVANILDAIIENDNITGLVDLGPVGISEFGSILDPSGVEFIGTNLAFHVMEFKN